MSSRLRGRFWAEAGMGIVTTILFLLTVVRRDWIEDLFGINPDAHTGSLEWLVVAGMLAATVALFSLAAIEWRKAAAAF